MKKKERRKLEKELTIVAQREVLLPTGAKATINENGIYSIGELAFGIDRDSMLKSVGLVERLPRVTLEQIVSLHGEKLFDGETDKTLTRRAQNLIQSDWYEIIKGEIPMAIKKKAKERSEDLEEKASEEGETKERKKRENKWMTLKVKFADKEQGAALAERRGHIGLIAKALMEERTANLQELIDKTTELGIKSQRPIQWVVQAYIALWYKEGVVVEA